MTSTLLIISSVVFIDSAGKNRHRVVTREFQETPIPTCPCTFFFVLCIFFTDLLQIWVGTGQER